MEPQKIYEAIQNGLPESQWSGKVIVIGAGISGITAAHILGQSGFEVQLLEASERYGGRIWSLSDFCDYPIELGAEEVHGTHSIWYELIKAQGKSLLNYENFFDEYYYIDGVLRGEELTEQDPDFQKALRFLEEMYLFNPAPNTTVQEAIQHYGISPRVRHLLETWISAEYGTSTSKLNLQNLIDTSKKWKGGEENFVFTQDACISVLEEIFADTIKNIHFNQAVQRIDYSTSQARVITTEGESFIADKIILTAPLGVLQTGLIQFVPNLPSEKIIAIQNLGIDSGLKIILKFKAAFWEEEAGAIYLDGPIGEFYTSAKDDTPVLTGLVLGDPARKISDMEEEGIDFALSELDRIMGKGIASKLFLEGQMIDWGKMPYVQGAYSYPVLNGDKYRQSLAESLENKIFFAGEASNYHGHPATVQGAIETAYRAVMEVLFDQKDLISNDAILEAKA